MSPTFPEAGLVLQLSVLGGRRNRILHPADQGPSYDKVDIFKPVCLQRMGPIKRGPSPEFTNGGGNRSPSEKVI